LAILIHQIRTQIFFYSILFPVLSRCTIPDNNSTAAAASSCRRSSFTCGRVADAGAAACDVADPATLPARQVPCLLCVIAADRRGIAVAAHPSSVYVSRHVGAPDRCVVTQTTHRAMRLASRRSSAVR